MRRLGQGQRAAGGVLTTLALVAMSYGAAGYAARALDEGGACIGCGLLFFASVPLAILAGMAVWRGREGVRRFFGRPEGVPPLRIRDLFRRR